MRLTTCFTLFLFIGRISRDVEVGRNKPFQEKLLFQNLNWNSSEQVRLDGGQANMLQI